MTYDTINDAMTIAGNGEGTPQTENGSPMDKSIGDGPTMRPKDERGGRGAFAPGDAIAGRYAVEKVLGEGGMGIVYQCLDMVGGVSVAVKCLPPEVSRNADEMDDIRANYRLVADLHHQSIAGVRTLELDESTGDYYLVMDLARGMSLKRWMRCNPQVTTEAKLAILRQVAAALDYAHAQKVIHRDVKPENVMVDDEGGVKVLDFGLAAQIRSSQSRTSNTVTSKGGTPGYKSPEQWLGRPQREPADVYSFGVMAYWMFAGELPFDGDDPVVLGHAVLSAPVGPIAGLPAHMNAALAKALAKAPEDRFSSCTAFVDALEGKVGSRVPRDRMGGSRSRATAKILVAAALIAALAGGAWWFVNARAARSTGTTGVPPVVTNDTSVADARREAWDKEAATEIRIEARVQQSSVWNISDEDGFKAKKDKLDKDFARADALFDEKVRRWSEAAVLFTNYVAECKALLTLDGERQMAKGARTKADEARNSAEEAEAKTYAPTRWSEAVRLLDSANADFAGMLFAGAERSFASAAKQFGICETDAQAEKKRREDAAAAQAKAAKEARERAEAEARERAENEARERERRAKWHKQGEEFTINDPYGLYMTMKWCPAGSFTMGSPANEEGRYDNETQHQVTLTKGFWMDETEVTQGQWKKIMNGETVLDLARKGLQDDTEYMTSRKKQTIRDFYKKTRYDDPASLCGDVNDKTPVYNVNWYEAVEFCRRLTQRERAEGRIPDGYEYRLPTEAEWEYACRAGTTTTLPNEYGFRIVGKNNAPSLDDIAWYGGNSSVGFTGRGVDTSDTSRWPEKQYPGGRAAPREVKGKQPNNWGLYDMIGNVWEWCGDWFGKYEYGNQTDPVGPASGTYRVDRGGGWDNIGARFCRSACRGGRSPGFRYDHLGFRVALAPMLPEEYRRAIQEELQKANVATRHEVYLKRERQPEKEVLASMRSARGVHNKVQLWAGGPYWATTNIGAERPEDYGYYFWWGDTVGYKREGDSWVASDGSVRNFSFNEVNTPTYKKDLDILQSEGWITPANVLAPAHDAASVHWGGSWRMPTKQELDDLVNKCDWNWTAVDSVNGYVVRGRGDYASKRIFLPAAGYGYGASRVSAGSDGYYWSSVPDSGRSYSWYLYSGSSGHDTNSFGDCGSGQSIRPVQVVTK